jgi:hypothetical protein
MTSKHSGTPETQEFKISENTQIAAILSILMVSGLNAQTINGVTNQSITSIPNASLTNSAVTISGACGISAPGSVSLGGSGTVQLSQAVNAQTGTTYTVVSGDCGKLITTSNASAIAVTLPQATTTFGSGFVFNIQNLGAGTVTITPTTSTINGASTFSLTSGTGAMVFSDGANWQVQTGKGSATLYTYNAVTFSATPAYSFGSGATTTNKITLTGNVTSSTISGGSAGQLTTFVICQDATGSRTFAWPSNFFGNMTIGSTLSKCNVQTFTFDGTNYYATSTGVTNI